MLDSVAEKDNKLRRGDVHFNPSLVLARSCMIVGKSPTPRGFTRPKPGEDFPHVP